MGDLLVWFALGIIGSVIVHVVIPDILITKKENFKADGTRYGYCTWCGSPRKHGGYYKDGFDDSGKLIERSNWPKCSSWYCFFKGIKNHTGGGGYYY